MILASGIVGAGGAGFPTHIKFNTEAELLIINGAECEPLLETDKYLMRSYSKELIESIEKVGNLIKAKRKVIGVKAKNSKEVKALEQAISEKGYNIEIYKLNNYYPAGDEQMLLREIAEVTLEPGSIPLSKKIIVSNVATLLDIYWEEPVT